MAGLSIDWAPCFGNIHTWFAVDKNGKIAMMINNNWGDIPRCLLEKGNINEILDDLNEYTWEESQKYNQYPPNKNGNFLLDMYCYWRNKDKEIETIKKELNSDFEIRKNFSDINIPINKGFFVYEAVEGNKEGDDYPVGYNGQTKMGDYFRYLQPTIYGGIESFPAELRFGIAFSPILDFTKDRILDNDLINDYFPTTL